MATAVFMQSCTKDGKGEIRKLSFYDFRPFPIEYTEPSCAGMDLNVMTSALDNFNGLKLTYSHYRKDANHRFYFTNEHNDTLILSLMNLFNSSCNYEVSEESIWLRQEPLPLLNAAVNFKMNASGQPKFTGYFGQGMCHAFVTDAHMRITFCNMIVNYFPLPGSNNYTARVSLNLQMPRVIQ